MFFSGHPTAPLAAAPERSNYGAPAAPYNPDTQYFGSVLLSDVIARLWTRLSVRDRRYLLERLVEYIAKAPAENRKMHLHLPQGSSMHRFAKHIETTVLGASDGSGSDIIDNDSSLGEYLERFASQ